MNLPNSPLSLWLAEYGPYDPNPPLQGDLAVEVAIIGGGFTGLATACALRQAQPGRRVAVLEHGVVGYGASGRNGSFAMTVVGLGFGTMAKLKGRQFVNPAKLVREEKRMALQRGAEVYEYIPPTGTIFHFALRRLAPRGRRLAQAPCGIDGHKALGDRPLKNDSLWPLAV